LMESELVALEIVRETCAAIRKIMNFAWAAACSSNVCAHRLNVVNFEGGA